MFYLVWLIIPIWGQYLFCCYRTVTKSRFGKWLKNIIGSWMLNGMALPLLLLFVYHLFIPGTYSIWLENHYSKRDVKMCFLYTFLFRRNNMLYHKADFKIWIDFHVHIQFILSEQRLVGHQPAFITNLNLYKFVYILGEFIIKELICKLTLETHSLAKWNILGL